MFNLGYFASSMLVIIIMTPSSRNNDVTIWRPSVRLSVPSSCSPWLNQAAACDAATVRAFSDLFSHDTQVSPSLGIIIGRDMA